MNIPRRRFLRLIGGAAAAPIASRTAIAQAYPTRPVRIIVPFPPGQATDTIARVIAQSLTERLGQGFVIENRTGAGGNIGTEAAAHAPPDGYTLVLAGLSSAFNANLYKKLSFSFVHDIAPVASIGGSPYVLVVNPSINVKTIPEFVAYAKANQGNVNIGSSGNGSVSHVFGELFKMKTGISLVHVANRNGYIQDLLGGQTQVVIGTIASCAELVRAGKLVALAVTTAARSAVLPEVPAVDEYVPGYDASQWYGFGAPTGTPAEIVSKLNSDINASLADPKLAARLAELGVTPTPSAPADFGKFIVNETERWGKVIEASNIKPQ